ncbi:MAG: hypothetical protein HYX92_21765 [Chloroflexi bacterium]|nr:hypothetical protein [Chloroflexota bacterium]
MRTVGGADIHQEESSFTYAITASTYNTLLKPDPNAWPEFKPVPSLATSWQVSADGKAYSRCQDASF